ncbi:PEP-CTERM sorting domain-containing protein [Okeania sp.]|uniref:PEP-CTERM sorting domain-containing protein n=1 Tax=Okeania sp. TaxID=3100323 RepID=UPI002B4B8E02|nr:PEP-CTERM sorting domain-containing protein [Okeania sp.]MEB3341950.1 PEP-CTERM sorting domain-containing protein [Okeania sp.]
MKNQIVASILSVPFALGAAVFATTGAANAASLSGSFQFDGSGDPPTTLILTDDQLDFNPDDAQLDLKLQTESFTSFDSAFIYDLENPVNPNPSLFIDLGDQDGENLLYVNNIGEYVYTGVGLSTIIGISFDGFFESTTGEISQATGLISLTANDTVANVQNAVENGTGIQASFTGFSVATTSVPEPTTLFGLGVVATGLVASRRKKDA